MFTFFLLAIVVLILFFARLPFFLEVLWFIWRVASVLLMWLSVVLPRSMQFIFYKKCPPYFHDIFDEMVALVKNKGFTLTGAHLRQPRFWFWSVAFPCWITVYAYAFRPLPLVVISDLSDLSGRFMFVVMTHELGHLIDFENERIPANYPNDFCSSLSSWDSNTETFANDIAMFLYGSEEVENAMRKLLGTAVR